MSEQKLKPVDFDVLIASCISVQNPDGEVIKLDDECGISVFELEDHRYEPCDDKWHFADCFEDGLIDKLREAGFELDVDTYFRLAGPREGYCWPWDAEDKPEPKQESPRLRRLLEQEKDDNLSLVRQRDGLRDLLTIAMYMVDRECADILRRQAQMMGVSLTEEK